MDTDSNYFEFSEDSIDKLIKPEMREEYEKDKFFFYQENQELHPTFKVDGKAFTLAKYGKRTPGLFKVETTKYKMISLCSKMYCAEEDTNYCDWYVMHVKILNVYVLINVNVILNFRVKAYKDRK